MRILLALLIGLVAGFVAGSCQREAPPQQPAIERVEVKVPECKATVVDTSPAIVSTLEEINGMFATCMKAFYMCSDDKDHLIKQKGDILENLAAARAEAGLWQSKYMQAPDCSRDEE